MHLALAEVPRTARVLAGNAYRIGLPLQLPPAFMVWQAVSVGEKRRFAVGRPATEWIADGVMTEGLPPEPRFCLTSRIPPDAQAHAGARVRIENDPRYRCRRPGTAGRKDEL